MIFNPSDKIFDTLYDTKQMFVTMKIKFTVREYVKSNNLAPVYLHITGGGKRVRIYLDLDVDPTKWDCVKMRLNANDKRSQDTNLLLDNIQSKLTDINTVYRLSGKALTPDIMKNELVNGMPRVKLTSFIERMISEEVMLTTGTINRHRVVLKKIKEFDNDVSFLEINENWISRFKKYLVVKGNQQTTINSNLASLKKFLKMANRHGIKTPLDVDTIKIGSTNGNRTALMPSEVKRLLSYWKSDFAPENYKLITAYFLFSCMTGLRISDLQRVNRKDIIEDELHFSIKKNKKTDTIKLNKIAFKLVEKQDDLFVKHFSDAHMNDELKKIIKICGITKKVSFHVARHTFATGFIRAGGNVEQLQLLMGHSSINQSMVYVHMVKSEANESLNLLDDLYDFS